MNEKQFPAYTGELANPVPDQFFDFLRQMPAG
jgi:hypothetical protein